MSRRACGMGSLALALLLAAPAAQAAASPASAQQWLWRQPLGHENLDRLRHDAENGKVGAQMDLARYLLRHGRDAAGVNWLTQANEQGDVRAQYLLGMLYLQGRAIGQDFDQARYFLGKAADQGYAAAQFHLGRLLINGPFIDPSLANESQAHVQRDLRRGRELVRKAAAAGYAPARALLARDAPAQAAP